MKQSKNSIFIISAPSGTGKSTLIQILLRQIPSLFFSISHTTRPPRAGEKDGVEYFFVDTQTFEEMIKNNQFLEWARVHGYYYGTSRRMVDLAGAENKDLLLDVDIQGAAKVRRLLPEAVSVFIMPPSYEVLKERLMRRQKDTIEQIQRRMQNAKDEIHHYEEYDFIVINDKLNTAFEDLASIIRSHSCRKENLSENIDNILESFKIVEK